MNERFNLRLLGWFDPWWFLLLIFISHSHPLQENGPSQAPSKKKNTLRSHLECAIRSRGCATGWLRSWWEMKSKEMNKEHHGLIGTTARCKTVWIDDRWILWSRTEILAFCCYPCINGERTHLQIVVRRFSLLRNFLMHLWRSIGWKWLNSFLSSIHSWNTFNTWPLPWHGNRKKMKKVRSTEISKISPRPTCLWTRPWQVPSIAATWQQKNK